VDHAGSAEAREAREPGASDHATPTPHHLVNLLLHAFSTGLVAIALRFAGAGVATVATGAAVFAAHPTTVEPVAWISGRGDLLCATFVLMALVAFQRCSAMGGLGGRAWWALAVPLCGAGAALSKETGIVLPAVLVASAVASGDRPWRGAPARALAASLVVAAALASWTLLSSGSGITNSAALRGLPRVALIGVNALLLRLPAYTLRRLAQEEPRLIALFSAAAVAGAFAVAAWLWRRGGASTAGRCAAALIGAVAPLALLAPFGWASDRHAYLPLALLLILGTALLRARGAVVSRRVAGAYVAAALLVVALGAARMGTWVENGRLVDRWCESFRSLELDLDARSPLLVAGFPSLRGGAPVFSNDLARSLAFCRDRRLGTTLEVVAVGAHELPSGVHDPGAAVEAAVGDAAPPPGGFRAVELRATRGHFGRAAGPAGHRAALGGTLDDPAVMLVVTGVDSAGDMVAFRLEVARERHPMVLTMARGGFRVVR
jgi:hypothetical protein